MTEQPEHDLVDFVSLAAVLTNEQRIMNALESIEGMLKARFTPVTTGGPGGAPTAETIKAIEAKAGSRRK
jgi:hypothetical protein